MSRLPTKLQVSAGGVVFRRSGPVLSSNPLFKNNPLSLPISPT